MMKVSNSFQLQNTPIFSGDKLHFGVDSNLSTMYCGTTQGSIQKYDLTEPVPQMKEELKLSNSGSSIPFVLYSQILDSLFCADFDGFIYQVKIVHEY